MANTAAAEPKTPASQRRAMAKYDASHAVMVSIKLLDHLDGDIIAQLAKQESKQGYIKALIRRDISGNND